MSTQPGAAQRAERADIREQYASLSDADIDAFIARGESEHLQLEFKTTTRADLSYKDDRRNLARALPGFANSDGGFVVWGVKARMDVDNVDRTSRAE